MPESAGPSHRTGQTTTRSVVVRPVDESAAVDVLLGLGAGAAVLVWRASRPVRRVAGVVLAAASAVAPPAITSALADQGREARGTLDVAVRRVLQLVVPLVVRSALRPLDLTTLVREHVDLDWLAAELDVAAVVDRVDLDAVVSKVDLDAVINRIDLDAVVSRVDLDAVAGRLDLDAVAARLDLDRLVQRVDVEAVLARLDLASIAQDVIAAIDLPEILRQSSGTLASEAIRGVRSGGMQADDVVGRFVDRLLRRGAGPAAQSGP